MIEKIESVLSSPFISIVNLLTSFIVTAVVMLVISPVVIANISNAIPRDLPKNTCKIILFNNYDNEPDNED